MRALFLSSVSMCSGGVLSDLFFCVLSVLSWTLNGFDDPKCIEYDECQGQVMGITWVI